MSKKALSETHSVAIGKELLGEITAAFLSGYDQDEALKLKIYRAIADQDSGRAG